MSMIYKDVDELLNLIKARDPHQPEFHQAVDEVLRSVWPFIEAHPEYQKMGLLERIVEPERVIMFRVPWVDDNGRTHVNRGYRVQMSSAIGPYKGGLRFHPSVNLSKLKFLAFEQVFKNSLTTLPMGGGKGGSDFDPRGRSDQEVMRFCQSFMSELYRHIGPNLDIPAGDINVGAREVGFLFGQYKRLANEFTSTFTGKDLPFGGSLIRPEATGYGCVYFIEEMLRMRNQSVEGLSALVSGSGNVAQYGAKKLHALGAKVHSFSDSNGSVISVDGFTSEQIEELCNIKNIRRGRVSELAQAFPEDVKFFPNSRPWQAATRLVGLHIDVAMPCACENELDLDDAKALIEAGTFVVAEGANMPSTAEAVDYFVERKILYAPGKASNAGGVAVSGLEMSQNAMRLMWSEEEVDAKLRGIMKAIHAMCVEFGAEGASGVPIVFDEAASCSCAHEQKVNQRQSAINRAKQAAAAISHAEHEVQMTRINSAISGIDLLSNSIVPPVSSGTRVEQWKEEGKISFVNYVRGANIAGFVKVADAMIAQGVV